MLFCMTASGSNLKEHIVTRQGLLHGLRKLGVCPGDILGVHSSLSSLGYVVGGAKTVLEALFEAVGQDGTLVMSTYLLGSPLALTPSDQANGITWKVKRISYDDLTTPTGMGAVSDEFRRHPQVVRWFHPIHSVAAWGKQADKLCQGFRPMVEAGGKILLLGVQMDRCSALHLAEENISLPEEIQKAMRWEVPGYLLEIYPPDQWLIGCQGAWGDFLVVQAEAEKLDMITSVQIGSATARLFVAKPVIELYAQLLRADPYRFFDLRGCNK